MNNKKISQDKKTYSVAILVFIFLTTIIGYLCFRFYRELQSTVKSENQGYMEEISKQMATNVNNAINSNFSMLNSLSIVLEDTSIKTFSEFDGFLNHQRENWELGKILLLDGKGKAYDSLGNLVLLNNDEYLIKTIVNHEPAMSTSQLINGKEYIVFTQPVELKEISGIKMVGIATTYDSKTFDTLLSMSAFDGKGYSNLIEKDGTIVIRSSSSTAVEFGYNIINSMDKSKLTGVKDIEDLKSKIENSESGQVEFTLDGAHEYLVYTPLKDYEWTLLMFVPVSVVNEKSSLMLMVTLLSCAIITIGFSLLIFTLMLTFYRNKKKLEKIAYEDKVTGGNTIEKFYELVNKTLDLNSKESYAIIYINIKKFKMLNEQFGSKSCNDLLRCIEKGISKNLLSDEHIGRIAADNFSVLIKYQDEKALVERLDRWMKSFQEEMEFLGLFWFVTTMEFGVYVKEEERMPIAYMINRAKLSLTELNCELKGKYNYAIYDESVSILLKREQDIEDQMEDALLNNEFEVYLQPKYIVSTEEIGGAEALVRWINPREGMILPMEFIPLFEKNGFIIELDLYVFEEVCKTIRLWIDQGKEPLKISVNCSRMHLKEVNFIDRYIGIAKKYDVPLKYLEIELTENVVFANVEKLSQIIQDIRDAGFGCSMDDFGSGYSSLGLVQEIPIDTIKLDKLFFKNSSKESNRTESIVSSVISMSKKLEILTVAEGIEYKEQVEMLRRLGCDFIQGYYYACPMTIKEFERLAFLDD